MYYSSEDIVESRDKNFPYAPHNWNEQQARDLAREEGVELDADHLKVLQALQEYFSRNQGPGLNMRELHDALNEAFHLKGGMKYLYRLFPGGPVAQGCRLAGLGVPAGAVDHSFGSVQ